MKRFTEFFTEKYLVLQSIEYTDRTLFKRIINEQIQDISKQQKQNIQKVSEKDYLDDSVQVELIKQYKANPNSKQGLDARNKVVQNKYKWISVLARKAANAGRITTGQIPDAIQNAVISMINGIQKYDPERGIPFTAYIKDWILAGIVNPFNPIRQRSISADTQGRDGTSVASLDAPVTDSSSQDKQLSVADKIADDKQGINPFDVLDDKDVRKKLSAFLYKLPEKEAKAIKWKFLDVRPNGKQITDEQIGKRLGMTKMGAKYLIDRAVNRLKTFAKSEDIVRPD